MFGKAFGILIRNQISLVDLCNRIELPGSIGESVQLIIKQALYDNASKSHETSWNVNGFNPDILSTCDRPFNAR